MGTGFRRARVMLALVTVMVIALAPTTRAQADDASAQSVIDWNANTLAAIGAAQLSPSNAILTVGLVQAAVYDALVSIAGGYTPFVGAVEADPDASQAAAAASAAHAMLTNLFPDQAEDLQAKLDTSLATVEDGPAKDGGIAVGQAAAEAFLASREGDGRNVANPITPSDEAGGWRPTPPEHLDYAGSWIAKVKPFFAEDAAAYRTAGPLDMSSAEYAAEFEEVKSLGSADPATRTDEQNAIATFWMGALPQWQGVERALVMEHGLSGVDAARLLAVAGLGGAEAAIGCFDDKYYWMFWRPITAIVEAESDGNDATAADPAWTSLAPAPPYPDHPSGFNCYSGSQAAALRAVFGSDDLALTFKGVGAEPPPDRSFTSLQDVKEEIITARVLQGIHFRAADEQGFELGEKAGQAAADRLAPVE
jgi:hypothetical protein